MRMKAMCVGLESLARREAQAGASIPWGNETEVFILSILEGNFPFREEEIFCYDMKA